MSVQCEVCKQVIQVGELYEGTRTGAKHSMGCIPYQCGMCQRPECPQCYPQKPNEDDIILTGIIALYPELIAKVRKEAYQAGYKKANVDFMEHIKRHWAVAYDHK